MSHSRFLPCDSDAGNSTSKADTTCLKWGSDGELSELDLQRILGLLSQADPVAEAIVAHRTDSAA